MLNQLATLLRWLSNEKVRKRSQKFPNQVGGAVEFPQPAVLPHTDFSVDGAFMRMAEAFPGQESVYRGRSFDLLKYVRPLIKTSTRVYL